ncbi:glycosyltransferase family 2 protein [Sphingopyxis sp.]|uniref:glycosyltransferase family 2 protein n=1 Tax=Sphingopyxis sp. TaxID=1908224 RepID=UPI001D292B5C|nr:glycosyltransferase family 2 protein [Sphingopyxis sp.]MBW8295249.1 glycosyltransferase family 2 protein [Sphingopyxis sp.]
MIEILAWLLIVPLSASLLYLGVELLFGLFRIDTASAPLSPLPRILLLVPAHDEAAGVGATVMDLRAVVPNADILVIADNCRDETAAAARSAGARVAERDDPTRRGKGYALAFGRDQVAADPPDVVIIVDADCRLAAGSAERLAAHAIARDRPVQAAYLLTTNGTASPLVAVSNFAVLIKNLVRARGLVRLAGGSLLFGTGMAFPWPLFRTLPLATSDAVEDLGLGLWLARQGIAVVLDERSQVTSPAAALASSRAQRSRWEHGFLLTAFRQGLPLLVGGIASASRHRAALGAHLLVPPLALLMLLALTGLALAGATGTASGHWLPFLILIAAYIFAVAMLLVAWWRHARTELPFAALLRVPLYMMWKIPIYISFFTRRQTGWNRTRRPGEED